MVNEITRRRSQKEPCVTTGKHKIIRSSIALTAGTV